MTYFPDDYYRVVQEQIDLKWQVYRYEFDLDEWEMTCYRDEMLGHIVVDICRAVATLDEPEEVKFVEYATEGIIKAPYTIIEGGIWGLIKQNWLKFPRTRLGLTAPFWQPVQTVRYAYTTTITEHVKHITNTFFRVVAAPNTRKYTRVRVELEPPRPPRADNN